MIFGAHLILGLIGIAGAILLFYIAKKFEVIEDQRIPQVIELLPGANCGGCGFPGCAAFAGECVNNESLDRLNCPVGGSSTMQQVAVLLGKTVAERLPMIAVVRCNGSCDKRPHNNRYDGASSCAISASLYGGETGCKYGCLGYGDCAKVCEFGAITIDKSGIPTINEELCTSCGACVAACPKNILELRNKGPKGRRIYVGCVNKDKGGAARKSCEAACIGCGKCLRACPFEAITVANNIAYIDYSKCRLCRRCVLECPTHAIHEIGFPVRKIDESATEKPAAKPKPSPRPIAKPSTETPEVVITEPAPTKPSATTVAPPSSKATATRSTTASTTVTIKPTTAPPPQTSVVIATTAQKTTSNTFAN